MKLTKYAQSCILLETKGKKILVDPGQLQFEENLITEDWNGVDIILITHKHGDHCYEKVIQQLVSQGAALYATQEVADAFNLTPKIIKEGDVLEIEHITIQAVKSPHGYIPPFKGPKEIYEQVGFIIDDNEKRVYITGDSLCFKNEYKCDVLVIACSGHGFIMGAFDAALFAKETGATLVIPTHLDHPKYTINKEDIQKEFEKNELKYQFLEIKERIEV
jgi:L-ascorbate metabolism protein UlaG (beta-lactamase superfamily)